MLLQLGKKRTRVPRRSRLTSAFTHLCGAEPEQRRQAARAATSSYAPAAGPACPLAVSHGRLIIRAQHGRRLRRRLVRRLPVGPVRQ